MLPGAVDRASTPGWDRACAAQKILEQHGARAAHAWMRISSAVTWRRLRIVPALLVAAGGVSRHISTTAIAKSP